MCVIDIFSKYSWAAPVKDKKGVSINYAYIEMYLIGNEGKSVVAERFIRNLNAKIYKYMTLVPKNVYIDKLDDIEKLR